MWNLVNEHPTGDMVGILHKVKFILPIFSFSMARRPFLFRHVSLEMGEGDTFLATPQSLVKTLSSTPWTTQVASKWQNVSKEATPGDL